MQAKESEGDGDDSDSDECPDGVVFDEGAPASLDLDTEDVQLVMSQANVNKAKASQALTRNNGDVVNAIMALSE